MIKTIAELADAAERARGTRNIDECLMELWEAVIANRSADEPAASAVCDCQKRGWRSATGFNGPYCNLCGNRIDERPPEPPPPPSPPPMRYIKEGVRVVGHSDPEAEAIRKSLNRGAGL